MQQDGFSSFSRISRRLMVHIRYLVEGHRQSAGFPGGGGGVVAPSPGQPCHLLTNSTTRNPHCGHRDSSLACFTEKNNRIWFDNVLPRIK